MKFLVPILLAVLFLIPLSVRAQGGPPGGDRPPDQRPFERIEQLRKVRIIEMLELKEEESVRLMARMSEHETTSRELMKERGEALDRVERLVRNKAEAKEYDKAFADVTAADDKVIAEKRKFFAGLADILTPEQRGKMLLFERRFEKELREAMREAQQRRRRGENP
jgi:hypothetical protein